MPRVLLVEDDEDMRNLFVFVLQQAGLQVVTAGNGGEALKELAQGGIDAVVMDIMMPIMDGYSTMLHMRSSDQTSRIPIVVLTANPNMEEICSTVPNVARCFAKPVSPKLVAQAVQDAIAGKNSAA